MVFDLRWFFFARRFPELKYPFHRLKGDHQGEKMITTKKFLTISVLVLAIFSACTLFPGSNTNPLEGTEWELVTINESTPIPGRPITITFEDGEVHGSAGCNSYFGSYDARSGGITFGMLGWTAMACMDPEGIMQQEQEYMAFLSEVVAYQVEGNQLILENETQNQLTYQQTSTK